MNKFNFMKSSSKTTSYDHASIKHVKNGVEASFRHRDHQGIKLFPDAYKAMEWLEDMASFSGFKLGFKLEVKENV